MNLKDAIANIHRAHTEDTLQPLTTVWGDSLDKDNVLSEYPRPQMVRPQYEILNGLWDYSITSTTAFPTTYDGTILVPFSPECSLSGVNHGLLPNEYLWYHKDITVTAPNENDRLILHFQAVDQACLVFVGQTEVASHHGGYLPFSVDITDHIPTSGVISLIVCVTDPTDTSWHTHGKQTLQRGGMFYTSQSGIWQTVWYEWVPENYISGLSITPDYDEDRIGFHITTNGTFASSNKDSVSDEFTFRIYAPINTYDDTVLLTDWKNRGILPLAEVTSTTGDIKIRIPDKRSWTPEAPYLYPFTVSFGEDTISSYFAMRCFTTEKDASGKMRFCLNHTPLFLNGVLDQGYWPDGLMTAPSDEALLFDIRTMQEYGFNMLRKHIKVESARFYYHCDRLGMLIWQDMINGGTSISMPIVSYIPTMFTKKGQEYSDSHYMTLGRKEKENREEWTKELADMIQYLYNVPSIATWVPFNEGWGQFDALKAVELIRSIDTSRPIDHASGWFDQGGGDYKSVHNYFRVNQVIPDKRAFVISEFGGYACHLPEHSSVPHIYGYKKYPDLDSLNDAVDTLYHKEIAPLIPKGLCGIVYTQVSDVEEEVNGLLTYDRRVRKVKPESTKLEL